MVTTGKLLQVPLASSLSLSAKHSSSSAANISRWLLQALDLDGKKLRKNERGEVNNLSFRQLARLCIVDETEIQAPTSPFLTGQFVSATTEKAAVKLLLTGEDDSQLAVEPERTIERQVSRGKEEMLDRAVAEIRGTADGAPAKVDLIAQIERLNSSIGEVSEGVQRLVGERDDLLVSRLQLHEESYEIRARAVEVRELTARFLLLRAQYDSDLERLDTIEEAGTVLGYFTPGVCAFCGAGTEHQNYSSHSIIETTQLGESVAAERSKTQSLRADLLVTLSDLTEQHEQLLTGLEELGIEIENLDDSIQGLDSALAPRNNELQGLLEARAKAERYLEAIAQIDKLDSLRGVLEVPTVPSATGGKSDRSPLITSRVLGEYLTVLRDMLDAWGLGGGVAFDSEAFDIVLNGQARSERGKGVRSVLHAGANLALAKYCADRDIGHPGFVILDSPLVTYRDPFGERTEEEREQEALSPTVAEAFFLYLQRFPVQVIVAENIDPPVLLDAGASSIRFTGRRDVGRYGFFPT